MNIGIVLLCRYASKRLPGKILRQIGGRSVLGHILDRLYRNLPEVPVVVATSIDSSDNAIAAECGREGVACYRGPYNDVAARFVEASRSQGWDFAVRLNGDNLFVDTESLRGMISIADTGAFDFVTNVPGRRFPKGMSVEVVRTEFLEHVLKSVDDPDHREHVTLWLYDNPDVGHRYVYPNRLCPEAAGLDLALDTADDLSHMASILQRAGPDPAALGLRDIYRLSQQPRICTPWKGEVGPLLIAEIGGNHEGDFETAQKMTRSAIESGADCVKFQIYTGDTLVSPVESPNRHKHFQSFELEPEQHRMLAQMCHDAGVGYVASVWDGDALDWIDDFMSFYKVGSGDLTAWPLLARMADRGKPILLSTGLATLDEVIQTVRYIQSVNDQYRDPNYLCILQCTAMYPIPDEEAHLRVMERLRAATGVSVGYSDHTLGSAALRAAAAMGAQALEFHFTDSREGKTFRDHKVSLTEAEVKTLKEDIARITALRGSDIKAPQPSELEANHQISFRRGAYLRRDISSGETIKEEDVVILRPLHGVDARDVKRLLVGATARRDIKQYHAIDPERDI